MTIENSLFHQHLGKIAFPERGIVFISGKNGSGKTSFLELLYWALTGKFVHDPWKSYATGLVYLKRNRPLEPLIVKLTLRLNNDPPVEITRSTGAPASDLMQLDGQIQALFGGLEVKPLRAVLAFSVLHCTTFLENFLNSQPEEFYQAIYPYSDALSSLENALNEQVEEFKARKEAAKEAFDTARLEYVRLTSVAQGAAKHFSKPLPDLEKLRVAKTDAGNHRDALTGRKAQIDVLLPVFQKLEAAESAFKVTSPCLFPFFPNHR